MTRVAGMVGWPEAARIAQRRQRTVRYWSEENCKTTPPIAMAVRFDAAYRAAGGEGAPFAEAHAHLLGMQTERQDACRRALAEDLSTAARETGEATAQAIIVATSNASPRDTMRAVAEAEQGRTAMARLVRRLSSFLPAGATPAGEHTGGRSQ
jgi:hypothetical protein